MLNAYWKNSLSSIHKIYTVKFKYVCKKLIMYLNNVEQVFQICWIGIQKCWTSLKKMFNKYLKNIEYVLKNVEQVY